jgi:YVTN family beta-propeller protein
MNSSFKTILKVALGCVALVLVVAGAFLLRLVYIGEPDRAMSLEFKGFVLLPKGSALSVLDYLTIRDHELFVTNESTGNVYKIALGKDQVPRSEDVTVLPSAPAAHGVALVADKSEAFVTLSEINRVDVFDPHTMTVLAHIPVADDPDGIIFDAEHGLIYAVSGDAHQATLIDPQTRKVAANIPLGGKPEFMAFDPQTKLIYQNLRDTNSVAAVNVETRSVADRWELNGCSEPSGMAIDVSQRRLFIVCSANAHLEVFDLNTHRVIASLIIGGGPDSVAFDSELHRIYTTGKSGTMSVIRQDNPDSYHLLDSIKLHYGAHTLAVDPTTHDVYVGYASLLVQPRVAVFSPRM